MADQPEQPAGWQPPAPGPQGPQGPPQWPPPEQGYWQQPPPPAPGTGSSGKATAALVLGICGLVVCPLICSILALVFGYSARREIDATGGRMGGRGNAVAGIVLGWIGLVLSLIGIVAFLALLATGNFDDPSFDDGFDDPTITQPVVALVRVAGLLVGA